MSITDIWNKKPDIVCKDDKDTFTTTLGPASIRNIPVVSGLCYDEHEEANYINAAGKVVFNVNQGYYPGQRKIREVAANRANTSTIQPLWAEFGVELGRSAFFFSHYLPKDGQFYLFDSFQGLPEDWALSDDNIRPGDSWACEPPTFDDERLIIVPGWFDDTLPHAPMAGPLSLLHIDCDVYSSTKTVLERLDEQIVTGTVILFDELWGYPNWRNGEYKALQEWDRKFSYLVRDTKYRVLIEVL